MNCTEMHEQLPLLVSGDLTPDAATALEKHLAGCAVCRQEQRELREAIRLLQACPAPAVRVNTAQIYATAALQQGRRLRRWRRFAGVAAALAALLLLTLGLRVDVRITASALTLTWGAQPLPQPQPPPVQARREPAAPARLTEDVRELKELVELLVADVAERDQRQQETLLSVQVRLRNLQGQMQRRCDDAERDIHALYTAQFPAHEKGVTP